MGALTDLILHSGGIVTRAVNAAVFNWMMAVSAILDNLSGGTQAEVRYVNKAGSDATGDGSFDNPFLTIQAAITSITDAAAAKPYTVLVAPGVYTEAFLLAPFIFVTGTDRVATILSNPAANYLGAGFAGAAAVDTGISNCTLAATLTVNFAAIGSTGVGRFFLYNVSLANVAFAITGATALNDLKMQGVQQIGTGALTNTLTDIVCSLDAVKLRTNNLTLTGSGAFLVNAMRLGDVTTAGVLTLSCASVANFLFVQASNLALQGVGTSIVLTGDGAVLQGFNMMKTTVGPDADTTFGYLALAGSTRLLDGGTNYINAAPTAPRSYTIGTPSAGTRTTIKNNSNFVITIVYSSLGANAQTYIPPFGSLDSWFATTNGWETLKVPQSGSVALTNGVSAAIPADIGPNSMITATLRTFNGATGIIQAKGTDRVNGTRAGGGSFKLTSVTQAAGATVATDQGTYDWVVDGYP